MATAERGGSAKPFEKGLSQNFKQINSPLNPNLFAINNPNNIKKLPRWLGGVKRRRFWSILLLLDEASASFSLASKDYEKVVVFAC